MNYYNEFDPFAAAWLRELIKENLIPQGIVDERSIVDVKPEELREFKQCHFFAGIGGWSYALQLAGWQTDRPVWTGSCPCQPFSSAGKQKGKADERHLWPVWFRLIRECRPPIVFGEQVASAVAHGWLDDVYKGLEAEGYACGSAVLPACSVGAPHKRDRLWFTGVLADSQREQTHEEQFRPSKNEGEGAPDVPSRRSLDYVQGDVAYPPGIYAQGCKVGQGEIKHWRGGAWINCPDGKQRLVEPSIRLLAHGVPARVVRLRAYGNAIVPQVAAEFVKAYMEILK